MRASPVVALLIVCIAHQKNKTKTVPTTKTDSGLAPYYYIVKLKDGKTKRLTTIASSAEAAKAFALQQLDMSGGKLLSGMKRGESYQWQRPI